MLKNLFLKLFMLILFTSCTADGGDIERTYLGYSFDKETSRLLLVKELNEISGLQWAESGTLLAVADEKGTIYIISENDGEVLHEVEFDGQGDYEGVAMHNGNVYALQSNGDVFEIKSFTKKGYDKAQKIKTGLDFDSEGICYSKRNNQFYIACKNDVKGADRAVFSIDTELKNKPKKAIKLEADTVKAMIIKAPLDKIAYRISDMITASDHSGIINLAGIAIHPITHDVYLLSGTSALLIVINSTGKLKTVIPLPADKLPQPEGITFSTNGDLYIASEKANNPNAVIHKYTYNE